MVRLFRLVLCALAFVALGSVANAQTATLLADHVEVRADSVLEASGDVEVLYEGTRLRASKLTYDRKTNTLTMQGPISIVEENSTLLLADSGELTSDLREGILRGARMVLDQQVQIAAVELSRVDGRYTQLYKTVASSCQVCASRPVPLWQIRARQIVHDQEERQLYFYNAQFRIGNVPVLYFPRLRMPDPTQTRSRGFLVPSARTDSRLGTGLRLPYFIPIGDHADITLTPFISAQTRTIEARYRQAFRRGDIELNAAVSRDTLEPELTRAYLFGDGSFTLSGGFKLTFDLRMTSDPAYLLDYGYSDDDRLQNAISVSRTRSDSFLNFGVLTFETLRGSELAIDDQLPNIQAEASYEKRFFPALIGGQGEWQIDVQGHTRQSDLNVIGRDVIRVGGHLGWSRSWLSYAGLESRLGGEVSADAYRIDQDDNYTDTLFQVVPMVEAEFRWPLSRQAPSGAYQTLEPVAHFAWTTRAGSEVPNEDSTLVELDEGNLYSISRFPGEDRYETGFQTSLGIHWTHFDPNGWNIGLTAGRVFKSETESDFSIASGLRGTRSDWLLAGQFKLAERFSGGARALIADDFSLTKAETRLGWHSERMDIASTYAWTIADMTESREDKTSQMTLDAAYDFNRHWEGTMDWRYDFQAKRPTRAAVGLVYRNECVTVDLSLSRRFTSSTSVDPTTDIGLSVSLNGFGSDGKPYRRSCSG